MTERPIEQKGSGANFAWVWMLLAVLAVGGFLGWLAVNSQAISVAVVEEAEEEPQADFSDVEAVELDDLMDDPASYFDQALKLENLEVTSSLGEYAFWALNSQGIPFLVKFSKELVEEGLAVEDGDKITVIGQLQELNDFVLDGWEIDGVLQTEEDRMLAEFATEYFDVVEVEETSADDSDEDETDDD